MAKSYRAKRDVTFPRVLSSTGEGEDFTEVVEGTNYPAGSVISHNTLREFDKGRAERGELEHLLDPMDDEEAESAQAYTGEPEHGIFIPEHEAEAHALLVAGHQVVPKEQALESLSSGEEHAANYQRAVREHGLDHRPIQEHLAQVGQERVPDEVLYGAETPAGVPHNRGPAHEENDTSQAPPGNAEQVQEAPRARPQFDRGESEAAGPGTEVPASGEREQGQQEA